MDIHKWIIITIIWISMDDQMMVVINDCNDHYCCGLLYGDFHKWWISPILVAGWFIMETPIYELMISGSPYFRKPPYAE
jgi:hypothetical protein